uniref:Uncharacterized protein n=1 Tax=Biomphalaria glabrata TaxID=6526 RepID=A0A2C9LTW0_BIOGL
MPKGFMFGKRKRYAKPRGCNAHKKQNSSVDIDSQPLEGELDQVVDTFENDDQSTENFNDSANISATERKLGYKENVVPQPTDDLLYYFISSKFLSSLVSSLCCINCLKSTLSLTSERKSGFAKHFEVYCNHCNVVVWQDWTSQKAANAYLFDVNVRSVLACKESGINFAKLSSFCGAMTMNQHLDQKTFLNLSKKKK